jgi:hypothetical protein
MTSKIRLLFLSCLFIGRRAITEWSSRGDGEVTGAPHYVCGVAASLALTGSAAAIAAAPARRRTAL